MDPSVLQSPPGTLVKQIQGLQLEKVCSRSVPWSWIWPPMPEVWDRRRLKSSRAVPCWCNIPSQNPLSWLGVYSVILHFGRLIPQFKAQLVWIGAKYNQLLLNLVVPIWLSKSCLNVASWNCKQHGLLVCKCSHWFQGLFFPSLYRLENGRARQYQHILAWAQAYLDKKHHIAIHRPIFQIWHFFWRSLQGGAPVR